MHIFNCFSTRCTDIFNIHTSISQWWQKQWLILTKRGGGGYTYYKSYFNYSKMQDYKKIMHLPIFDWIVPTSKSISASEPSQVLSTSSPCSKIFSGNWTSSESSDSSKIRFLFCLSFSLMIKMLRNFCFLQFLMSEYSFPISDVFSRFSSQKSQTNAHLRWNTSFFSKSLHQMMMSVHWNAYLLTTKAPKKFSQNSWISLSELIFFHALPHVKGPCQ